VIAVEQLIDGMDLDDAWLERNLNRPHQISGNSYRG